MKVGIFGGSFNPPHKMHEEIANNLLSILDKVIFVPTGNNYSYKNNLASGQDRYNMLNLLVNKNKNIEVSDFELKNFEVHTYDTLEYYRGIYDEVYFICGTDNLTYLDQWYKGEYILENYKILVIKRNTDDIKEILERLNKYKDNIIVFDMKLNDISSTYIRDNIDSISDKYLDKDVKQYILNRNLYR